MPRRRKRKPNFRLAVIEDRLDAQAVQVRDLAQGIEYLQQRIDRHGKQLRLLLKTVLPGVKRGQPEK